MTASPANPLIEPFHALRRGIFRTLVRGGFSRPVAWMCARDVRAVEAKANGGSGPRHTLLALSPDRFRGDLTALAATGAFRVLRMSFEWQARLYQRFSSERAGSANRASALDREAYRAYLFDLLPILYTRLGVDAVISAAIHYRQDREWGAVSQAAGFPYIVLHRENLVTNEAHRRRFVELGKSLGKFEGAHLIVHNEATRDAFLQSNFISPGQVSALGAMRMDGFLKRIAAGLPPHRARPRLVFFSFAPGTGLFGQMGLWPAEPGAGLARFFANVHGAIGEIARDHPDIDVVIKPKWGGHWLDGIHGALRVRGIDAAALPNLTVSAELDAQDLILNSDAVIAFGSTTMLEAAVAGRPVVVPFFDEAADPAYGEYIHLRSEFDAFDVARSEAELKSLALARLRDPSVPAELLAKRRALFDRYVSAVSGGATARYTALIERVIAESRGTPERMRTAISP